MHIPDLVKSMGLKVPFGIAEAGTNKLKRYIHMYLSLYMYVKVNLANHCREGIQEGAIVKTFYPQVSHLST